MQKNVSGQKWYVFAFDLSAGSALIGVEATITAKLAVDGTASALSDINPVSAANGYYTFDLTQAETNGNYLGLMPACTTTGASVVGVPGAVFTLPSNITVLSIDTSGYTSIVNIAGVSALSQIQTAAAAALTARDVSQASVVTAIKTVTDALPNSGALTSIAQAVTLASAKTIIDALPNAGALTSLAQAVTLGSVKTIIDALPNAGALTSLAQAVTLASVKTIIDALPDAGALTSIAKESTVAALNNISIAQVYTQAVSALTVYGAAQATTFTVGRTQPAQGAAPSAPSALLAIDWLYKFGVNKFTQTSAQSSIYDYAGSTIDHKRTISDDGTTLTVGAVESGS